MTPYREGIRQAASTMAHDSGGVAARAALSGIAIVGLALWETTYGLLFALMLGAWLADMLAGSIAAGWKRWTWERFTGGLQKFALAVVAVVLGVLLDLATGVAGLDTPWASGAVMLALFGAFGASAAKNIGSRFPSAAAVLSPILTRLPGGPTKEEVEQAAEVRRGNPPGPPNRGLRNGTDGRSRMNGPDT